MAVSLLPEAAQPLPSCTNPDVSLAGRLPGPTPTSALATATVGGELSQYDCRYGARAPSSVSPPPAARNSSDAREPTGAANSRAGGLSSERIELGDPVGARGQSTVSSESLARSARVTIDDARLSEADS